MALASVDSSTSSRNRLKELDIFRGIAMLGMFAVSFSGNREASFHQLRHAAWHGCRLADIVFPMFLVAVGAAVELARKRSQFSWRPAIRRAAILFLLGYALDAIEEGSFLVDLGVLQRISICYLAVLPLRNASTRFLLLFLTSLFALYLFLMLSTEFVGLSWQSRWEKHHTVAELVDTIFLPSKHPNNEGLVSTITAIASTISGMILIRITGMFRADKIFSLGCALLALGLSLALPLEETAFWIPLNKRLWTPSYVLSTSGLSYILYATLVVLPKRRFLQALFNPLAEAGANALTIYVAARLISSAVADSGLPGKPSLRMRFFDLLNTLLSPPLASLAYSLLLMSALLFLAKVVARYGFRIKV